MPPRKYLSSGLPAKRRKLGVEAGTLRGFVVSSNSPGHWRDALRELHGLLVKYGGVPSGDSLPETTQEQPPGYDEELEGELQSLRASGSKCKFVELAKGVGFLSMPPEWGVTPSAALLKLFDALAKDSVKFPIKYILRAVPIDVACRPHCKHILAKAEALIRRVFPDAACAQKGEASDGDLGLELCQAEPGESWCVIANFRNVTGLSRREVIDGIGALVNGGEADGQKSPGGHGQNKGGEPANHRPSTDTASNTARLAERGETTAGKNEAAETTASKNEAAETTASKHEAGETTAGKNEAAEITASKNEAVETSGEKSEGGGEKIVEGSKDAESAKEVDEQKKTYPVDLKKGSLSIIIDVHPLFCGLSVCRGYFKNKRFNLSLMNDSITDKDDTSKDGDQ